METMGKVNFGELVLSSMPEQAELEGPVAVKRRTPKPEFEVACSGVDFTVRRKTAKTSKLLVILVSQGQYYLKDEVTGKVEALDAKVLEKALDGLSDAVELDCPWIDQVPVGKGYREKFVDHLTQPDFELVAKSGLAALDAFVNWVPSSVRVLSSPHDWYACVSDLCKLSMPLARYVAQASEGPEGREVIWNTEAITAVCRAYGLDRTRAFVDRYVQRVSHTKELIQENGIYGIHRLKPMLKVSDDGEVAFDFDRLCDYLFDQSLAEGTASLSNWLSMWMDALNMQEMLYDEVRDKYPRNLSTTHDVLSLKVAISKIEIDAKLWSRAEARMARFDWEPEGAPFIMTHPTSTDDLRAEGASMSHCVAGYAGRITEGKSMVFFCRRVEDRDRPYVTVEVDPEDMRIVQVKARFNHAPDPEAREFVECWGMEHGIAFGRRAA